MMNLFVKNGRVRKFWLTEVIPNILVRRTNRNFKNLCIDTMKKIGGLHVSMHCSMASEVMESFSLFLFTSINQACF